MWSRLKYIKIFKLFDKTTEEIPFNLKKFMPRQITNKIRFTKISVGKDHFAAINKYFKLYTWG